MDRTEYIDVLTCLPNKKHTKPDYNEIQTLTCNCLELLQMRFLIFLNAQLAHFTSSQSEKGDDKSQKPKPKLPTHKQ